MNYPCSSGTGFAGLFDGGDNILSIGISSNQSVIGDLIGYLEPTGTVKNLNIVGEISVSGSVDAIGGAVGYNSGTINDATTNVIVDASGAFNVGGVAGFNDGQ